MENLIKQMRVRFSGVGEDNREETGSIRGRSIPPQRTQSFKGEKKKNQNWFRRQFPGQMNQDYDSMDGDAYSTAVAAAALAVKLLEESSISEQKKKTDGPDKSAERTPVPVPRVPSKKLSDKRVSISAVTDDNMPEKAIGPALSIKRAPTSADKQLTMTETTEPEAAPKPEIAAAPEPEPDIKRQRSRKPEIGDSKADAWEKSEMTKIKDRYEKLIATISKWEDSKKTKARRKMDRIEGELEKRRAKAMRDYRSKMETIDQIAGGARSQADKNRRNEEFRAKDKANKIRPTGKLPAKCFCF